MCKLNSYVLAISMIMSGTVALAIDTQPIVKRAFYSVPVAPELAPFATFELKNVSVRDNKGSLSFFYELPPELVGLGTSGINLDQKNVNDVSDLRLMVGRQAVGDVQANIADASCGKHPFQKKKLQCMIVYHSLKIDEQKTRDYLTDQYRSSFDFKARLNLADAFKNEPAGILVVELE